MAVNTLAQIRKDINGESSQNYIKKVLGNRSQEFTTSLLSIVGGNPLLQECTTQSLMTTAMKAASLNLPLDPNLGLAYPVPYDNSKKEKRGGQWVVIDVIKEAQFQIGAKGFIQLALRSGQFEYLNVRDVREGEIVGEDFLSGMLQFKSLPLNERHKAPVVGYVAYFKLLNGFQKMLFMTNEELLDHAKEHSASYKADLQYKMQKSLWNTNFKAMAEKTVIKLLISKYAPMSIQLQDAIKADQAVFDESGRPHYVDLNQNDNAEAVEVEVVAQANKTELPPEEGDAKVETKAPAPGAKPLGQQKEPDIFSEGAE